MSLKLLNITISHNQEVCEEGMRKKEKRRRQERQSISVVDENIGERTQ